MDRVSEAERAAILAYHGAVTRCAAGIAMGALTQCVFSMDDVQFEHWRRTPGSLSDSELRMQRTTLERETDQRRVFKRDSNVIFLLEKRNMALAMVAAHHGLTIAAVRGIVARWHRRDVAENHRRQKHFTEKAA